MIPPLFALLSADAAVGAQLGAGSACRVYPWGQAPDTVARPYATWYVVAGGPENTMSDTPGVDRYVVQVDVWGDSTGSVVAAGTAVRNCIETMGAVTAYNPSDRDTATGRYRVSFDAEIHVKR